MQTFLPYPNIFPSVAVLDNEHLSQQRIDAKKILDALQNKTKKYRHHPAIKMWRGYEELLKGYLSCCISQWVNRGHKNNIEHPGYISFQNMMLPWWWGGKIHDSHKSYLVYKNPEHYKVSLGKDVSASIFYQIRNPRLFWPTVN